MLHDGTAAMETCSSLETPKPKFSQPLFSLTPNTTSANHAKPAVIEWDWALEHADRKREAKADSAVHGAPIFSVDRNILRDVIKEKMECRVGRITFLSSGARGFLSFPLPKCHSIGRARSAS